MVAIAQRLFSLLGNTIVRQKAERVLILLYAEGYVPVRRSELIAFRAELHAIEAERIEAKGAESGKILARAQLDHLLAEWQRYNDRLDTRIPAREQRKR